jgi:hypothetical protein
MPDDEAPEDEAGLVEELLASRRCARHLSGERACAELHAYRNEIDGTSRQGPNNRLDEDSV